MLTRRTSHLRPGSARAPRSLLSAVVTRFFRGTLTPVCGTFRRFGRGSAQNSAREIGDLASDFASLQFSKRLSRNTKRREVAAHEGFRLAGPTGLEPATSGVTGPWSNERNCARSLEVVGRSTGGSGKLLIPSRLAAKFDDLATHLATRKLAPWVRVVRAWNIGGFRGTIVALTSDSDHGCGRAHQNA